MKYWWNDTDRETLEYWDKNLSQSYCVHHKSHMDWSKPLLIPLC
jgi:hypothetical protein